jgi:hypothetical protein
MGLAREACSLTCGGRLAGASGANVRRKAPSTASVPSLQQSRVPADAGGACAVPPPPPACPPAHARQRPFFCLSAVQPAHLCAAPAASAAACSLWWASTLAAPDAGHHLSPGDPRPPKARRVGVVSVPASVFKKPKTDTPDRPDVLAPPPRASAPRAPSLSHRPQRLRFLPPPCPEPGAEAFSSCAPLVQGGDGAGEGGAGGEGAHAGEAEEGEGMAEGEMYDEGSKRPRF